MQRAPDRDPVSIKTPAHWRIGGGRTVALDRAVIMGILNVTPDSFSDGGKFDDLPRAVEHAAKMVRDGASIIDIGGESTRPGAQRIDADEQIRRVIPVIEAIAQQSAVIISIDTTRAAVARAALDAGASIINDVSAGTEDAGMLALAGSRGCGLILMHRLRPPGQDRFSYQYDQPPRYDDVVDDVRTMLLARADAAIGAGVDGKSIVIDPGLGFGKSVEQNYELIARTGELIETGYPVLSAASRKSFLGAAAGIDEPSARDAAGVAVSAWHFAAGARLFRVHDVRRHTEALAVTAAILRASKHRPGEEPAG